MAPNIADESIAFDTLVDVIYESGTSYIPPREGLEINIANTRMQVLSHHPFSEKKRDMWRNMKNDNISSFIVDDSNKHSVILQAYLDGSSILFLGDAGHEEEKRLVTESALLQQVDIIKVGHHGSKTSTTRELIQTIRPKRALISAGEKNSYGHPHQSVLDILQEFEIEIYKTSEHGSVSLD